MHTVKLIWNDPLWKGHPLRKTIFQFLKISIYYWIPCKLNLSETTTCLLIPLLLGIYGGRSQQVSVYVYMYEGVCIQHSSQSHFEECVYQPQRVCMHNAPLCT